MAPAVLGDGPLAAVPVTGVVVVVVPTLLLLPLVLLLAMLQTLPLLMLMALELLLVLPGTVAASARSGILTLLLSGSPPWPPPFPWGAVAAELPL